MPAPGSPAAPAERFGSEAKGRERTRMVGAFRAYTTALGRGAYKAACADLAQGIGKLLRRAGSRQGEGGCAGLLARLPAEVRKGARRSARGKVEQVRVDGDAGRVIVAAADGERYQMPMRREGGAWKVGAIVAPALVASR